MEDRRAYPLVLITLLLSLVTKQELFVWLALALVAILIARPRFLDMPAHLLETVGKFVGTTASNIVLSVIFFVVVVPYGYLYRALEKKSVQTFFVAPEKTTYATVKKPYTKDLFEKTW